MKFLMCLAALCCVFFVLNHQYQEVTAIKKKTIFKKLRDFLPLLLALKGKRKLLVLPLPIPIKINKSKKESWSAANSPISWPLLDSYLPETSWPSMLQHQPQSAPQTYSKTITHTYLQPEYGQDHGIKQSDYFTSYQAKDGASGASLNSLNYAFNSANKNSASGGYNSAAVNSAYNGYSSSNYGSSPTYEASAYGQSAYKSPLAFGKSLEMMERRPLAPSKSSIKKPLFGQPLSIADEYETGKGTAPVYNDAPQISPAKYSSSSDTLSPYTNRINVENKVQFQKSISNDYNGGSTYSDSSNNDNNIYKSQNQLGFEDNGLRSVNGDYTGNQLADAADNSEENNELGNNESVKEDSSNTFQQNYKSNLVPNVGVNGYKKSKI